jgi:hypothetical protein
MVTQGIKIRPVRLTDNKQLHSFFTEVDTPVIPEYFANTTPWVLTGPLRSLHSRLPLSWKTLQEGYIAIENNTIQGLISLEPDSRSKHRWKINQLYLKPNAYDVGKLLIDYIVNKYGADGVETFITEIDALNTDAANLFQNACGFRFCTNEHIFKHDLEGTNGGINNLPQLKKFTSADSTRLYDLHLECLKPQAKVSLEKTAKDFSFNLADVLKRQAKGISQFRWVLEEPESKHFIAANSIVTFDNNVFYIYIYTALPYADYYSSLVDFCFHQVGLRNRKATAYIRVCEAIQSHSKLLNVLQERELEQVQSTILIVKDYWRPLKERKPLTTSPIIIFPEGTSTAYNPIRIVEE